MKSIYNSVIFIVIFASLSSCYTTTPKYLYAPNSLNLLHTEKKGDVKAAFNYAQSKHSNNTNDNSGRQISNGIETQIAYCIIDKLVFKGSALQRWETDRSHRTQIGPYKFRLEYKRKAADISIGYYKFLGDQKKVSLNLDAGTGIGKTTFTGTYRNDTITKYFYSANHYTLFISPSIVLKPINNYSLTIAYRLSSIHFHHINTNDAALTNGLYAAFANKKSIYGDIVFENEFGFNKLPQIRFQWQLGFSKLYTHFKYEHLANTTNFDDQYQYNNNFGLIGLVADLKQLLAKK
jgi:hypothetical protein